MEKEVSPEALAELHKIVSDSFTLPHYDASELCFIPEILVGERENAGDFQHSDDVVILVLHTLPPRLFLNFGETCEYLHSLTLSPCFYLRAFISTLIA
jgi:hypothetical protein